MADAWGGSWGTSWGLSWTRTVAPPAVVEEINPQGAFIVSRYDRDELLRGWRAFQRANAENRRKIVKRAVRKAIEEETLPPQIGLFARVPVEEVTKVSQINVAAVVKDEALVRMLLIATARLAEDDDEEALWILMH